MIIDEWNKENVTYECNLLYIKRLRSAIEISYENERLCIKVFENKAKIQSS